MSLFPRLLAAVLLSVSLVATANAAQQVVDKVVAQVNGEMITLFELNERVRLYVTQVEKKPYDPNSSVNKELQSRILASMVEDILLRQEAVRMKVNISDAEVEARIKEMREKGKISEEQFVQQLRLEGMSRKQFADSIKKDILKKQLLGYMVQRKVLVSEDEIRKYYDENKGDLRVQTGQRVGLIMVAKMDEAKALRQRIASGQISFADAARKHSIGPGADQGGDIGKVELKDLAPELRQALQDTQPGGVSQPVLLDGKPVLLTVGGDAAAQAPAASSVPSLESMHDEIQERIYRVKLEKQFTEYMDKLRAKSVIKINL
ncbi:SurA N-terminal domain-containing protein [Fundidesulfovibrio agrisoli]|uniref:SurA N-terminal domain-containing protein n=1 Tax=Fundidesulfovibrio agrisoli TaxID=2922717 RepID=UPI001FAE5228|nr:SurA N-terminal domain-containing protein [Fundidesulfovibrio agrisoli]